MAKYKIIPSSRTIVQSPISIGHKAEKGVQAIEFDLTAWVETYGSGTLTVIMRRWGDAIPYPIALEIDENNKATWTLSDIDTAKAGMAYAQLNYIVGDEVVKKSDIYTFRVMDSLTGEGDPPEAYESWLEHLTHLAAEAMAEVLDIEGIATDKTLTIDGGIADAKATGDALALKADKSTTYTKTEVDRMIEDVEVETDTTLGVAGAAADAAETGRQIGLLKADLVDNVNDLKSAITNIVIETVGKNLWNPDALNTGRYYGGVLDDDTNFRSIIIGVNPGDIVTCSYKTQSGKQAVANIYSVGIYNGDTITSTPSVSASTYTVPDNVFKIGVSVRTGTYGLNIQIEITENGQYTAYETYTVTYELNSDIEVPEVADARGDYPTLGSRLDEIDAEIENLQPEADAVVAFNLFDYSKWTDGFIKSNGTTTTQNPATVSSTYATSELLEAKQGDIFVCSAQGASPRNSLLTPIGYFAEYSESGVLLSYYSSNQNSAKVTNENTAFVRLSIRVATYGTALKLEKNQYGLYTAYTSNTVYKNLKQPSYVFVPKYIYCAVGRTIEIYNSQIVLDCDDYNVQWICNIGSAMSRKFTVTATSAMLSNRTDSQLSMGQYRLFINVYNKANQLVWQGCSIIWIKAALASAKSVIPIGDSLTNWKKWLPECIHLSNNNLTFVGTRYSGADQDSAGNEYASGTIHHEGRSGWSAASYLANTEYTFDDRYDGVSSVLGSANPFWDGAAFSLNHYLTTQDKSVPDAVQIWLGTNDIAEGVEPSVTNILSLINNIRTEYPSLKIIVCNTIYRSNQDGYASVGSDGYAGASGALAYAYNEDIKVIQLAEQLTLALLDMQNVFVSPLYCSHDTEFNFGWTEYHPNPRAEQIVHIPAESVHPATQGYWQLADILFSAYSVILP